MSVTEQLKQTLWSRYGSKKYPSEWDGNVYGGGKISQRFWEYLIMIQMLELDKDSIVLDIGGGSPRTGMGFFSMLLQPFVKHVVILDPEIGANCQAPDNVTFIREYANKESLKQVFADFEISHVSSVSVFEHAQPEIRNEIMYGINRYFKGDNFSLTLEFHAVKRFFQQQPTTKTLSEMVKRMTKFYVSDLQASPLNCVNAHASEMFRLWYPLAVKFKRNVI